MDKEATLSKISEIGTCEDEARRRELLTELRDEVSSVYDDNTRLTNENNQYLDDNEALRSANMKLFLRIGDHKPEDKKTPVGEPAEKRKFENLFDEKGGIK